MVHKNLHIDITVKENRIELNGHRTIIFDRPSNFTYEPGDWIDLAFGDKPLRGGKTYSLSSSPTEPDLMITFKDGISEIKRALTASIPGQKFTITQYGNDYAFTLNPHKASTLIAGGIGIAPFRSMLKELEDTDSRNKVDLIYLNKSAEFLFEVELNAWQKSLPDVRITYIVTEKLQRKARNKIVFEAITSFDQQFYIAGPEGMVEATEHMLLDAGVKLSNIKIDSFGGY